MDTKRLILFIVAASVILVLYQSFFAPKPVKPQQPPASTSPAPSQTAPATGKEDGSKGIDLVEATPPPAPAPSAAAVTNDVKAGEARTIIVDTPLYTAEFSNRGAALTSFVLKKYKDDKGQLMNLVSAKAAKNNSYPFHFYPRGEYADAYKSANTAFYAVEAQPRLALGKGDIREVVFTFADSATNTKVEKKFVLSGASYRIGFRCNITKDGRVLDAPVLFGPDLENNVSADRNALSSTKISVYNGAELKTQELSKIKTSGNGEGGTVEKASGTIDGIPYWAAYQTAYFAAVFKPDTRSSSVGYLLIKANDLQRKTTDYFFYMVANNPTALYLGPKDEVQFETVDGEFTNIQDLIDYGWFGALARLMLKGLIFIHGFLPNYGWAIVLFTLFLKILLFPLTYFSSVSMAKMQTLQPKIKALRKKYKNNRDPEERRQMNMEMMDLYKQEKVNPMGGCLPLLLQLPILFGFFRLLSVSITMRHEPWILWITDLSKKDPYYILPILMGATQIVVQMMTPSGGDETQKKLMYIMPVVMVVMFAAFPSGLNLYWFASNLLQIGQQYIINQRIFAQKKEEDKARRVQKRKKGVTDK